MNKGPEGATSDITADLAALRKDVARLSESIGAVLQRQAQGAVQHVSDAVGDAKTQFASAATDVKSRLTATGGEIEVSIERHPLTAMLITFAVGMALGMMSRPRH